MPQKSSGSGPGRADVEVLPLVGSERVVLRPDAPALLLTIESNVAQATCGAESFTLDRSGYLLVPAGRQLALRTPGAASRVARLTFHPPLEQAVAATYRAMGIDREGLRRTLARLALLPRTTWVHELVHRYVFERCTCGHRDNEATAFLEAEILKEVHFLLRDRDAGADRTSMVHGQAPCVQRALAHIEAHLFRSCSVAALAATAGASQSTLLRAFRRELGCSPAAYWRNRKLDEALMLLRAGSRSVGEVAERVGYDNPTAFAFAFRARFGRAPSAFVPKKPVRPAP